MRSGPSLEIVLDKPELLIRGSFDEAAPVVLSGKLVVHLHEHIRVRSLKLSFSGRIDTFVSQSSGGSSSKDEHREFIAHTWTFLEPQKAPVAWGPESKAFPFDLLVPGDNPETVHTTLGKVRYRLQATLERTSFHGNLVASVDVPVKRGPVPGAPWALALMESIEATGNWGQQLDYRVSVPTRSLKDAEVFHTRFEIEPRAKGLRLISVGVLIKEYLRYYSSSGEPLHRFARVVARNENYISPAGTCSTVPRRADECLDLVDATSVQIPMAVPPAYTGIQYDVHTDLIEIRHRIKFLIKVRDPSMLVHSVFIAVPVTIMPVTARDDSNILPRYETALQNPGAVIMRSNTLPPTYDAATGAQARAPAPPPMPPVGERAEVDGFPGPLHRSRSQFYLASPDHSPPLQPLASPTFLSPDALPAAAESSALPAAAESSAPHAPPADAAGEASRRSSVSSKNTSSLHELLAGGKLTDKVRSIFHHHSRHNSSSTAEPDAAAPPLPPVRSLTPPPAHIHEPSRHADAARAAASRGASAAPGSQRHSVDVASSSSSTLAAPGVAASKAACQRGSPGMCIFTPNPDCAIRNFLMRGAACQNAVKQSPDALLHGRDLPVQPPAAAAAPRQKPSASPPMVFN